MGDMQKRYQKLFLQAKEVGQEHIFQFWDELTDEQKEKLLSDVEKLDFSQIDGLVKEQVVSYSPFKLPDKIESPNILPVKAETPEREKEYKEAWRIGEELIAEGKVCAFTVAGGMGTRLGFNGPKGTFPISPLKGKSLFQIFAETIQHCRKRYNPGIRWYIMTSEHNHNATIEFFQSHSYFELPTDQVIFFKQGMLPAFSKDGKILLDQKYAIAFSPDGHGGSLRALRKSGALDDMRSHNIEYISYFQVDNPLVYCLDPKFIGLHRMYKSEMSSKSIPKRDDLERVGNFAIGDGKLMVIEYSDLPDELAHARNPDGSRKFDAGSIAIHIISRTFVEKLTEGELKLPYHRAIKKVTHIDDNGNRIQPAEPNAIKLEQFIFDAIPLAENPIVVETRREEEFSPVKNAEGQDSPETCRKDMIARARRWLESANIYTDNEAIVEISPLRAIFPYDL